MSDNTINQSLPNPDGALPKNAVVDETAKLHATGQQGIGGLGSSDIAQTTSTHASTVPHSSTLQSSSLPSTTTRSTAYPATSSTQHPVGFNAEEFLHEAEEVGAQALAAAQNVATNLFSTAAAYLPSADQTREAANIAATKAQETAGIVASNVAQALPTSEQVSAAAQQTTDLAAQATGQVAASLPSTQQVRDTTATAIRSAADALPTAEQARSATDSAVSQARDVTDSARSSLAATTPPPVFSTDSSSAYSATSLPHANQPGSNNPFLDNNAAGAGKQVGGMAAVISDEIARAAVASPATSIGTSSNETTSVGSGKQVGGMAGVIADEVAHAAERSSATSVGESSPSFSAGPTAGVVSGSEEASDVHQVGGLAAVIAEDVARAAERSTATSVGSSLTPPSLTSRDSALETPGTAKVLSREVYGGPGASLGSRQTPTQIQPVADDHSAFRSAVGPQGQLTPGGITPGQELPGGWGHTGTVRPDTTIYQDAEQLLKTVGQVAFTAIPHSLIERFSNHSIKDDHPIATTTNTLPHESTGAPAAHIIPTTADIQHAVENAKAVIAAHLPTTHQTHEAVNTAAFKAGEAAGVVQNTASNLVNAASSYLPSTAQVQQTAEQTRDAAAQQASAAANIASEQANAAAESLPSTDQIRSAVPAPSQIIPTDSDKVNNRSLASTELPSLGDISNAAAGAVHNAAAFLGLASPTSPSKTSTGVSEEPASIRQQADAAKGGFASTIAEKVAHAAEESSATSAGSVPLSSQIKEIDVLSAPDVAMGSSSDLKKSEGVEEETLVGGGGLAATIADEVAAAAEDSSATSAGSVPLAHPPAPISRHSDYEQPGSVSQISRETYEKPVHGQPEFEQPDSVRQIPQNTYTEPIRERATSQTAPIVHHTPSGDDGLLNLGLGAPLNEGHGPVTTTITTSAAPLNVVPTTSAAIREDEPLQPTTEASESALNRADTRAVESKAHHEPLAVKSSDASVASIAPSTVHVIASSSEQTDSHPVRKESALTDERQVPDRDQLAKQERAREERELAEKTLARESSTASKTKADPQVYVPSSPSSSSNSTTGHKKSLSEKFKSLVHKH